jgi:hypothetical protein
MSDTPPTTKNRLTGRVTRTLNFPFLRAQEAAVADAAAKIEETLLELLRENWSDPEGPGIPFAVRLKLDADFKAVRVMLATKRLDSSTTEGAP